MNTSKKNSTSGNRNAWIVGGVIAAVIAIAAIVAISASSKKDSCNSFYYFHITTRGFKKTRLFCRSNYDGGAKAV